MFTLWTYVWLVICVRNVTNSVLTREVANLTRIGHLLRITTRFSTLRPLQTSHSGCWRVSEKRSATVTLVINTWSVLLLTDVDTELGHLRLEVRGETLASDSQGHEPPIAAVISPSESAAHEIRICQNQSIPNKCAVSPHILWDLID